MKNRLLFSVIALLLLASCHNKIWDAIDDLDGRITTLEILCKEMNTNIISIQTIIDVQQTGDYITSIVEVKQGNEVIGYTITFAKHESITIFNGTNGKDGKDGKDAEDSKTPIIGVAQDTDGVYYWTINGEWLLDDNGNKLRVSGKDGKDGNPGSQGNPGNNGKDGVTPQLKIEDGYWYISYNGGSSWTQLGKATGADGAKGDKGDDGQDGDSMFQSVTYDANTVTFTLADGTVLYVPVGIGGGNGNVTIENGAIMAKYAVSATNSVYFSQGNLQYNAMAGTRTCNNGQIKHGVFRFAEHQYDYIGQANTYASSSYNGWIDLFQWATSGYHDSSDVNNVSYEPYSSVQGSGSSSSNRYGNGPSCAIAKGVNDGFGGIQNYDWGVFNPITNGGNLPNQWRTLTCDEWDYLFSHTSGTYVTVSGIIGYMIHPNNWECPADIAYREGNHTVNNYSKEQFQKLEATGVVFFPRQGVIIQYSSPKYWSSTNNATKSSSSGHAYAWGGYDQETPHLNGTTTHYTRNYVRLVKDVE